jgi:hypothetical protein
MLTYQHPRCTATPKPAMHLAPEHAPPPGAVIITGSPPIPPAVMYLTGWWVEPCWLCGTWLWSERRVNDYGSLLPGRASAMGRAWAHCDTTWKSPEALYVPALDAPALRHDPDAAHA